MVTHYVYSPCTGNMTSCITAETYCAGSGCGGAHTSPLGSRPIDVGGGGAVPFYGSATIRSIWIQRHYNVYCPAYPTVANALEVRLYTGYEQSGYYLGRVYYGHVHFLQPDGGHDLAIVNTAYGFKSYLANLCSIPQVADQGTCYVDWHVHAEKLGGTAYVYSCGTDYVAGSHPLYYFTSP